MRNLADIERDLCEARRAVFADDDAIADTASARIAALRAELAVHPDEVARRDRVHADANARFMRRWS